MMHRSLSRGFASSSYLGFNEDIRLKRKLLGKGALELQHIVFQRVSTASANQKTKATIQIQVGNASNRIPTKTKMQK